MRETIPTTVCYLVESSVIDCLKSQVDFNAKCIWKIIPEILSQRKSLSARRQEMKRGHSNGPFSYCHL